MNCLERRRKRKDVIKDYQFEFIYLPIIDNSNNLKILAMKYSEVLFQYQPTEIGDFMYRYYVNDREYIIYSPEKGKISCLELCNFSDLTPFQLSVSIQQRDKPVEEMKEFSFEYVCSKEALVSYLFDISSDQKDMMKTRRVSNRKCYLLYALKPVGSCKVRNLFQFDPETKDYQLVFNNDVCCASAFEDEKTDIVNVCWSPVVFSMLEGQTEHKNTTYLLASSNPILCFHVCKKAMDKAAIINLCVEKGKLEALVFLSLYLEYKGTKRGLSIFFESKKITVQMKNWNPVKVVNCIASAEKICGEELKKNYGEDYTAMSIFQLESVDGLNFVSFQNSPLAINAFFKVIFKSLKLDGISYMEL